MLLSYAVLLFVLANYHDQNQSSPFLQLIQESI